MSRSLFLTAAVFLITVFLLNTNTPLISADEITSTVVGPEVKLNASTAAVRAQLNQQAVETRREKVEEKIAASREKLTSRAAVLKAKLETFKDQQKAQIAERINSNLNAINQNQTSQMQKHLDLMTIILGKLENRVNEGAPDVKDPTATQAAIAEARTNISTASAAVSEQSQKDYTIQVTSESRIRAAAKLQKDKLHKDLKSTRKAVIDAKQSVANAIRAAKSEAATADKEATNSGQQ